MKNLQKAIAMLVLLAFFSCKTRHYNLDELPERQLIFGFGGGFTGALDEYLLLENGQLFYRSGLNGDWKEMKKVKSRRAADLMDRAEQLDLSQKRLNQPGNTYQFIEWKEQGASSRATWGAPDTRAPAEVDSLYRDLIDLI